MINEVVYLNCNWVYVNQYLKAALLLPIILQKETRAFSQELGTAQEKISEQQKVIRRINCLWFTLCTASVLVSALTAIFIDEIGEENYSTLIKNFCMVMLSGFFVAAFYKSIRMIKKSLKSNSTFSSYVNERLIFWQQVSCLFQFIVFIFFIISREVELFTSNYAKRSQDYQPWCKANLNVVFITILLQLGTMFQLALILYMTIKFTTTGSSAHSSTTESTG